MFKAIPTQSPIRSSLLLKFALQSGDRGFTMFEVLIALMMSFLFLTGTLNAMVMATVMQVQAERKAQANYWIKEDLEGLRAAAAANIAGCTGTGSTNTCCNVTVGPTPVTSSSTVTGGFANALITAKSLTSTQSRDILNKQYTMSRTPAANPFSPQVLTITYLVDEGNSNDSDDVATLYTEILPAAALECS